MSVTTDLSREDGYRVVLNFTFMSVFLCYDRESMLIASNILCLLVRCKDIAVPTICIIKIIYK